MQPVIITGGPGAGKTTLIQALSDQGYATFEEVSRSLIEQQSALVDGILPWEDMAGFAALCLEAMSEQKLRASQYPVAFLDRAIPDICGYLSGAGIEPNSTYLEASQGYAPFVFMCQPHEQIYVQDEIRPYSYQQALEIHHQLVETYQQLGYHCIEVPFTSVDERVQFVITHLSHEVEQ